MRGSGIRDAVGALRFPIQRNYVYLLRRGGFDPDRMGLGVVPEVLGLAAGAIQIDGVWHDIHLGPGAAQPAAADELASPGDAHEANGS